MQRLLITTLSTIVLAAAVPVNAQTISATTHTANSNLMEITPFNLVKRAYQGYFKSEIPSNGAFVTKVNSGEIKARDLVKSAIASGRLSSDKLDDRRYINAVQSQLDHFNRN
jgi:hypothetical protein